SVFRSSSTARGPFPDQSPRPHATEFGGTARDRDGNVAIFAINAAKSFQLTACSTPDAGCRSLFRRLHVARWVNDRSSLTFQHPISADLFSGHVTYKIGDHAAWMNRECSDAMGLAYPIEADRKERVCSLRLSVGHPTVIFAVLEIWVFEIYLGSPVSD